MNYRRRVHFMLPVSITLILGVAFSNDRRAAGTTTPASWPTRSLDPLRSSANLAETILTQTNVTTSTFGAKLVMTVDDQVYAQPLYSYHVPGTGNIVTGPANVLYVATANNSVYAFNADTGGPVWPNVSYGVNTAGPVVNFNGSNAPPNGTQVNENAGGCGNETNADGSTFGDIGILGTPVLDQVVNPRTHTYTLYVVTHTMEGCSGSCGADNMTYRIRALNAATGAEVVPSQIVCGTGSSCFSSYPHFGNRENQRTGLSIEANGDVSFGFASYCDAPVDPNHHMWNGYFFEYSPVRAWESVSRSNLRRNSLQGIDRIALT